MRQLIVGNWKMNGLHSDLGEINAIAASVAMRPPGAEIALCVPATLISRAVMTAAGRLAIGGECCHAEIEGPYTGEISAEMLVDAGARCVILGHSERRSANSETNSYVAATARAAARAGLSAIICIGETPGQHIDGTAKTACRRQLLGSVPERSSAQAIAIGYEPLWAIGSGKTPDPDEIVDMHTFIRRCLVEHLGPEGHVIRILYGGSVDGENAPTILALPEVGGALVGGASLSADHFEAVIKAASGC